jgi:hypothetical protein
MTSGMAQLPENFTSLKRVFDGPPSTRGSVQRWCADCNHLVWVDPESLDFIARHLATILCHECFGHRTRGLPADAPFVVIPSRSYTVRAADDARVSQETVLAAAAVFSTPDEEPSGNP